MKILRWILILPACFLVAVCSDFVTHFVLYVIITSIAEGAYPETPELLITPFVRAFLFVVSAYAIAPSKKYFVSIMASILWILIALSIFIFFSERLNTLSYFSVSMGIIGAVFSVYNLKIIDKENKIYVKKKKEILDKKILQNSERVHTDKKDLPIVRKTEELIEIMYENQGNIDEENTRKRTVEEMTENQKIKLEIFNMAVKEANEEISLINEEENKKLMYVLDTASESSATPKPTKEQMKKAMEKILQHIRNQKEEVNKSLSVKPTTDKKD
jgi:hypothetical protein